MDSLADDLLKRVRAALPARAAEQKMFGAVCFMLDGNMVAGVSSRGLLVRVGKGGYAAALAQGAQPMEMGERTMRGYVRVNAAEIATPARLRFWLDLALGHVATLRAKE